MDPDLSSQNSNINKIEVVNNDQTKVKTKPFFFDKDNRIIIETPYNK